MSRWFSEFSFHKLLEGNQEYPGDMYFGAYPTDQEDVAALCEKGVTRVLSLCEDAEYPQGREEVIKAYEKAGISESRLSLVDFGNLPAQLIDEGVKLILKWLREGEKVYLHCRAGWQRSAVLACATVSKRDAISVTEALEKVKLRRPQICPLEHQLRDLYNWEKVANSS